MDFYAPRLLEAAFEGDTLDAAIDTIRALTASDHQLFSNHRQRWFYLGLMSVAGIDVTEHSGDVVELVAPRAPERQDPAEPLLVLGGVSWPWQDLTDCVRRAEAFLRERGRGKLVVYGGRPAIGQTPVTPLEEKVPASSALEYRKSVPWPQLLAAYSSASAALDVMAPNAERELALSFRHVDYLACGLPIVTSDQHVLAPALKETGAGWIVEGGDLESALAAVLDDHDWVKRASRSAQALAEDRFSRSRCEAPLLDWVLEAQVRDKKKELLPERADLAAAVAELRAKTEGAQALQAKAEGELSRKREEVVALAGQVNTLTTIADRLSKAVDEVAGFKREAIAVLGAENKAKDEETSLLTRDVAELSADLAKKRAEATATARERDRIAADLEDSRQNALHLQDRLAATAEKVAMAQAEADRTRAELDAIRAERDRFAADNESLKAQKDTLQEQVGKKSQELAEANSELHRVYDKAGRFESELDRVNREVATLRAENERLSRRKLF